jgi:GNAT superfamily N-acetyltransferase
VARTIAGVSSVRLAAQADHAFLAAIEQTGDRMFAEVGIVFPAGPMVVEEAIRDVSDIFVVGDPPIAFAAVKQVGDYLHLEQISVHADHIRRGIGGRLLDEVIDQAKGTFGVTLITFRDVPWNGPWYARHGFIELPEERWSPDLRAIWDAEIAAGLHDLGPRLVMWRPQDQSPTEPPGSS